MALITPPAVAVAVGQAGHSRPPQIRSGRGTGVLNGCLRTDGGWEQAGVGSFGRTSSLFFVFRSSEKTEKS